jgi:GNAT superfamily N-acetyltransferase
MVAREHRRKGVGSLLLDSLCTDLRRQGLKGIQLGMLEEWTPWIRFLEKHGFKSYNRTADAVLKPAKQTSVELPEIDAIIRPVRLPEERGVITGFMNSEREEELPWACAIIPEFWTTGPGSEITDPKGFLVAEDKKTGEVIGVAWGSTFTDESGTHGMIEELDVAKGLLKTPLRRRLMLQILDWLWSKGVKDVQTRVHIGFKHEEDLYREIGFEFLRPAALWRKSITAGGG